MAPPSVAARIADDADQGTFRYTCRGEGDRNAFLGPDEITAGGELVDLLQCAGGFIG